MARTRAISSRRPATMPNRPSRPDGQSVVYRSVRADGIRGDHQWREPGIFIVSSTGGTPALVREARRRSAVRSHGHARLLSRSPRRAFRARERHAQRRRRSRALPIRERHGDHAVAGRQVGGLRRTLARVRRRLPAHRKADRSRAARHGVSRSIRSHATPASACTGRPTAGACTGRSGRSSSPATCTASFPFLEGRADALPHPRRPASRSVRPSRPMCRTSTIALTGARVVTMAGGEVLENATVIVEGNRDQGGRPQPRSAGGRDADRRARQDDHPRTHRRACASRRRERRAARGNELAAARQPRVRRDHLARSLERHGDRLHQQRAGPLGREARPAAVLDRHDPLRRGIALQGGDRELRRCAVAPAAAEGGRRLVGEELQPAAPRRHAR